MINHLVKIISVDGYYSEEQAKSLTAAVFNLTYVESDLGKQIENFNLVDPDANKQLSGILNTTIEVDEDSGVFRLPANFIHFEEFDGLNEWMFAVALQQSTFNVFEHMSGIVNATQGYRNINYKNLFEWDLRINYLLAPGDGILFRPWLFHSFDQGLVQIFRLKEKDDN